MIPQDAIRRRTDSTIKFVSVENDPWAIYRENYVEFQHQNSKVSGGIYRGLSLLGKLVLSPFIEMSSLTREEQQTYNIGFTLKWNPSVMLVSQETICQAIPRNQDYVEKNLRHFSIPVSQELTWEI